MRTTIILAATLLAAPALAEDYPFTGYYAAVDKDTSVEDGTLVCAASFFRQDLDGKFVNLLIDIDAFEKDGTVRFDIEGDGTCAISGGRLEDCETGSSNDPEEVGVKFFSVIDAMTDAGVEVAGFDEIDAAKRWIVTGNPDPDYFVRYQKCPFDEAALKPYLTGKRTKANVDLSNMLGSPPDEEMRPKSEAILAKIAGK